MFFVDRYDRDAFVNLATSADFNVKLLNQLDDCNLTNLCASTDFWDSCPKFTDTQPGKDSRFSI